MEQVNTIELVDPTIYPTDDILKKTLGDSFTMYHEILEMFTENGLQLEWKYYKDGKAWLCKVTKGKKTIIWMSAWKDYMKACIYIPEKYINSLFLLDLEETTKKTIINTKNIGKSKPCIFELKKNVNLKDFIEIIRFKKELK